MKGTYAFHIPLSHKEHEASPHPIHNALLSTSCSNDILSRPSWVASYRVRMVPRRHLQYGYLSLANFARSRLDAGSTQLLRVIRHAAASKPHELPFSNAMRGFLARPPAQVQASHPTTGSTLSVKSLPAWSRGNYQARSPTKGRVAVVDIIPKRVAARAESEAPEDLERQPLLPKHSSVQAAVAEDPEIQTQISRALLVAGWLTALILLVALLAVVTAKKECGMRSIGEEAL